MRTIIWLAGAAMLGACGQLDAPDENAVKKPVVEDEDKSMMALDKATYRLTNAEGRTFVTSYYGDGTVSSVDGEGETFTGTYAMTDGKLCLDWENDDYDDCYTVPYIAIGTSGTAVGDKAGDVLVNRIGYQETPMAPEPPVAPEAPTE